MKNDHFLNFLKFSNFLGIFKNTFDMKIWSKEIKTRKERVNVIKNQINSDNKLTPSYELKPLAHEQKHVKCEIIIRKV